MDFFQILRNVYALRAERDAFSAFYAERRFAIGNLFIDFLLAGGQFSIFSLIDDFHDSVPKGDRFDIGSVGNGKVFRNIDADRAGHAVLAGRAGNEDSLSIDGDNRFYSFVFLICQFSNP